MTIYRGVSGVNREIKQQFRGVGGVNREIKEQYRGVGGVNRKVFSLENWLIPTMTSNTSPSGSASFTNGSATSPANAYKAFDKVNSTNADGAYGYAYPIGLACTYMFPMNVVISQVTLIAYIDGGGSLTSGAIEYTLDGSTWTQLVALTSSNFVNCGESYLMNTYTLATPTTIKGIRTRAITSSNGRGLILYEMDVKGYTT